MECVSSLTRAQSSENTAWCTEGTQSACVEWFQDTTRVSPTCSDLASPIQPSSLQTLHSLYFSIRHYLSTPAQHTPRHSYFHAFAYGVPSAQTPFSLSP